MSDPLRPIDTALFDPATAASDDFYRHVNGGWLDANPVPSEYGAWGAPQIVHARNQDVLHQLLEDAAARTEPRGSAGQLVGDYFAAAMDEAAIAAAGAKPLAPYLARIDGAASVADVRAIVRDLQRRGPAPLHSLGVAPDFEDSGAYLVYVGQGGLGLPERDYYTRDDEQSRTLRKQYVDHVAGQLGNLGDAGERAREAAGRILAFETRLAEVSYTAEQLRDVQLTMNRHDVAALDELMPAFGLSGYVADLGVTSATVSVDNPGFFRALDVTLADTPVETLRDYLRWHLVRAFASALAPGVRGRGVRLLRPDARRAAGDAAALEARAQRRHRRTSASRWRSSTSRPRSRRRPRSAARRWSSISCRRWGVRSGAPSG